MGIPVAVWFSRKAGDTVSAHCSKQGQSRRFEATSSLTHVSTRLQNSFLCWSTVKKELEKAQPCSYGVTQAREPMTTFDFRAKIPLITLIFSSQVFSSVSLLLCGLLAGAIAALLTWPFSCCRTELLLVAIAKHLARLSQVSWWAKPALQGIGSSYFSYLC